MPDSNSPQTTPQFTTAEYANAGDQCAACHRSVTTQYYRVNTKMVCESCIQQLQNKFPKDSHAAYVRGLIFGIGAAILGMILYAGFTIVTGFYIGYVSLAVGWLVAKAIMLGSRGIGGRRYQIAAVILTYAAVSIAAVPIALSYKMKEKSAQHSSARTQQQPSQNEQNTEPEQAPPHPKPSLAAALLQLLLIGLASPFLELQDPLHGVIGLVILVVGIRIAWRMTAGVGAFNIQGPYENSAAASGMR